MAAGRADLEPQVRSEIGAAYAGTAEEVPSDGLFNRTPPDGTLVARVDSGNEGLYVRLDGTWERVSLDSDV